MSLLQLPNDLILQSEYDTNSTSNSTSFKENELSPELSDSIIINEGEVSSLNDLHLPHSSSYSLIHEKLGNRAFVIHNLLTSNECDIMISFIESRNRPSQSDEDITLTPSSIHTKFRNDFRLSAASDTIANMLYHRMIPYLQLLSEDEKICTKDNSHMYLNEGLGMRGGVWHVDSLNNCFRLGKYDTLGHFSPHYDGDYVIDPLYHRSMKTFMIYLNDDYEGGHTNFIDPCDIESRNGYSNTTVGDSDDPIQIFLAPKDKVFASYKPKRGDCIVFDHKILHEGDCVTSGCKYIMRSDIMYKKVVDETANNDTSIEERALRLYYEGMALESAGDITKACEKYRIACKLCPDLEKGV